MPRRSRSYFHHKVNRNGTHASVCPRCYITVATTSSESELELHEETHICDSVTAYQVSEYAHQVIAIMDSFAGRVDRHAAPELRRRQA